MTDVSDPHGGPTKYCFKDRQKNPGPSDPNSTQPNAPKLRVVDANGHHRSSSFTPDEGVSSSTAQSNDGATNGSTSYSYNTNNTLSSATQPTNSTGDTAGATSFDYKTSSSVAGASYLPSSSGAVGNSCSSMSYDATGRVTDVYAGQAATSGNTCSGSTGGRHSHVDYNTDGTPKLAYGPVTAKLSSLSPSDETRYSYYSAEPNAGELQKVVRPGGNSTCTTDRTGCTTYVYDGLSRVTQVTDGKNQATSYTYDADDRPTAVMTGGATTCTPSAGTCVQYAYDGEGNMTSRTDRNGTTSFTYDWLNQPATQTQPDGTVIATSYDAAGNLTFYSQTLPNQSADTVSYTYDGANQLTSVTDTTGTFNYTYNTDGRPTKIDLPSGTGVSLSSAYTKSGKVSSVSATMTSNGNMISGLPNYSYDYNDGKKETGNLHKTTAGGTTTTVYDYSDNGDRLQDTNPSSGTAYAYTYDADGNIRSAKAGSTTTYYGYNEADQLCWSGPNDGTAMALTCPTTPAGDTAYSNDANGNSLGTTAGPLHYNAQNQVDQISSLTGSGPVNQTYLDQGNNLRFTAGGDTFTTGGPLGITARSNSNGITYYTRDATGQILDSHGAGGTFYYETDRQSSTIALINTNGGAAATYTYTPYGQVTITNGTSTTAGQNNPWRYTGGYQDPTDGYYHLGARYYDTTGHFMQADPVAGNINRPEQFNSYTYTAGDPINNTDLNGKFSFSLGVSVCAFGGCLQAGAGVDSDGDVQVSGGVGTGVGGSVSGSVDPDGNFKPGESSVSESIGCNIGPVNEEVSTSDGEHVGHNTTLTSSAGVGCSASVTGSHTF